LIAENPLSHSLGLRAVDRHARLAGVCLDLDRYLAGFDLDA